MEWFESQGFADALEHHRRVVAEFFGWVSRAPEPSMAELVAAESDGEAKFCHTCWNRLEFCTCWDELDRELEALRHD